MKRIEREIKTVGIMIDMYCRRHHGGEKRCKSCQKLFLYARRKTPRIEGGEDIKMMLVMIRS
jgi:hypothetical protein